MHEINANYHALKKGFVPAISFQSNLERMVYGNRRRKGVGEVENGDCSKLVIVGGNLIATLVEGTTCWQSEGEIRQLGADTVYLLIKIAICLLFSLVLEVEVSVKKN